MRYARVVANPDGPAHPNEVPIIEAEDVSREQIHNVNLLADGTAVILYEVSGDPDRVEELLETADLYTYHLVEGADAVTMYAHFEPTEEIEGLLALFEEHELILNMPLEYTRRGGIRALVVGESETFRTALDAVPEGIDVEIEQLAEYEPRTRRVYGQLTDRQQETLLAAIQMGYYETPRQATQRDVAEELDCSDGTVGEHLRKIESTVFSAIAPV